MITKPATKSLQFLNRGLQTSKPSNRLDGGKYLRLVNVRSYLDGSIETRPGQARITGSPSADTPIHSLARLNADASSAPQARTLIAGIGTKLYSSSADFTTLTQRDSGYSGKFLSIIPHRPTQSPEPWMYVMDSSRSRKIRVNGSDNFPIGIAPPNTAPTASLGQPLYTIISDFEAAGAWTNGGTAGAIAVASRLTGATTITRILFDSGTTGFASIQPSVLDDNVQAGMFFIVNAGGGTAETVRIERIYRAITSTTIAAITFDSGTTGLCTIQLTAPSVGLERDALIRLNSGGGTDEAVRIQSVTIGPDGLASIRVSTANTHAATETIDGLGSFRAYCANTHAAAETLTTNKFRSTVTVGTGDLSLVSAFALATSNSRPIQGDDEIHISLRPDNPSNLLEMKILLDVDANTNDFTRNYYYFAVQPNMLTRALQNTTTTATEQQRILEQQQLNDYYQRVRNARERQYTRNFDSPDAPDPFDLTDVGYNDSTPNAPVDETTAGSNQWSEIVFKVSDLIRVGADDSRSLKNVAAIRIQVQATANVVLDVDAWWVGGTYGPDTGEGAPYLYCYTGRNKLTGATSNPSPPMRSGVTASRNRIVGTATQHSDSQVDVLDVYRYGGALNVWHFVTTIANGATPTFTDDFPDDIISNNPVLDEDNYQPFPSVDTPKTGTCNVSGTKVTRASGDNFNTSWGRNSIIKINGIAHTLYASPTSTTVLETNENVGSLTGATFEVPDAILLGQTLPAMWGPFGGGLGGIFMFACGDSRLPGTLFVTKGNNPDASFYRLEITSGSEPLINGCIYDGRPYVFSSERMYAIEPINGGQDWIAREVANSIGLWARWGLTVTDKIYFVGKDGIYESEGGQPRAITDDSFYNLFLHEAFDTSPTNAYGIAAFPFSSPDDIKLDHHKSTLYFNYKSGGSYYTLVYNIKTQTWSQDTYGFPVLTHCSDEGKYAIDAGLGVIMGGSDGHLYNFDSGTKADVSTEISCRVTTGYTDCGDPRSDKQFMEVFFDADIGTPLTTAMVAKVLLNDSATVIETLTPAVASGRSAQSLNINLGNGRLGRNLALDITWQGALVRIYEYHHAYYVKGERSTLRSTDWIDAGYPWSKWFQGLMVRADTLNAAKTFKVEYDGGTSAQAFTITHNGDQATPFSFDVPFIARLVRITTEDAGPWLLYDAEWVFEPEPELVEEWKAQPTTFDIDGFKVLGPTCYIAHRSTANLTLEILVDGTSHTFTVPHSSGNMVKSRVVLDILKGKVFEPRITSGAGFRLYKKACSIECRAWSGAYQVVRPFGMVHDMDGARI